VSADRDTLITAIADAIKSDVTGYMDAAESADDVLDALHALGYRVIGPEERQETKAIMDELLEVASELALSHDDPQDAPRRINMLTIRARGGFG
jgi:hypothetical protein